MTSVIKGDSNVNLDFSTGGRITGDFSNATFANRVSFQTNTANGVTGVQALPNGTSQTSTFDVYNAADPTNASFGQLQVNASDVRVVSNIRGTGSYLPMTFYTGGSERVRITSAGDVGIGTSSPASQLDVSKTGDAVVSLTSAGVQRYQLITRSGGRFDFQDQSAGATRWSVDQSGNLLVGTTTALSKLTVYANDTSSADASFVTLKGGAENIGWINYDNAFGTMVRLTGTKQGGGGTSDEGYFSVRTAVNAVLTGGVYIQGGGTSWTAISDERFKTDLKPIQNASEKVSSLRCVTGRYKTDAEDVSRAFLIAQDVQAVLPEAVSETTHDDETALGLAYTDVIPLLTAAIQELKAIVDAQGAEIAALKGTA